MSTVFALLVLLASGTSAGAESLTLAPHKFSPSQTELGREAAKLKLKKWKKAAKAKNMSLEKYAEKVLKPTFASINIPVVIDPKGKVRPLDGHHKISALQLLKKKTGVKVKVQVDVAKNYKGYSQKAYANHFVHVMKKGWFGAKSSGSAVEKVRLLPNKFKKMKDSTVRSVIGEVFRNADVKGSWFADYVQFHLGEKLVAEGVMPKAPQNPASDKAYLKKVAKVVWTHPVATTYLNSAVKSAFAPQAKQAMNKARVKYGANKAVKNTSPARFRFKSLAQGKKLARAKSSRAKAKAKVKAKGRAKVVRAR